MLLTIDIGNTNVTLGVYDGDRLGPTWRLATVHDRMPDEYGILLMGLFDHRAIRPADITGVAVASVVPQPAGPENTPRKRRGGGWRAARPCVRSRLSVLIARVRPARLPLEQAGAQAGA